MLGRFFGGGATKKSEEPKPPEIVFSPLAAPWLPILPSCAVISNAAHNKIKIPQDCWSKLKGGLITNVADGRPFCHIKANPTNRRILHFLTTSHEGFLVLVQSSDSEYHIYGYQPIGDGQLPEKGICGLHKSPLYLWATILVENNLAHYVIDDQRLASIGLNAEGYLSVMVKDQVEVARGIPQKSNMTPVVFLHIAEGLDQLAVVALTVCASHRFLKT